MIWFKTQKELFLYLWKKYSHYSDINGEYLGTYPMSYFFSHILGKDTHPAFKCYAPNILFMTWDQHQLWEYYQHKIRNDPEWEFVFLLEEHLKSVYNKFTKK